MSLHIRGWLGTLTRRTEVTMIIFERKSAPEFSGYPVRQVETLSARPHLVPDYKLGHDPRTPQYLA